ncbi:hypothetical protein [Haloplanus halophilus]|uniref:hypothetical protein n=1 Tax=Haloplanus halophilus TaxID=2949993 RepID=UPI0020420D97|nr:hypothetical protein [Haloplanus sp. GDY1]
MSDLITVCPACDSPAIKPRTPAKFDSPDHQASEWYCNDCQHQFDEPVRRERRGGGGRNGLAGKLVDADPDDLRADGGREEVFVVDTVSGEPEAFHLFRSCCQVQQAVHGAERVPRERVDEGLSLCPTCRKRQDDYRAPTRGLAKDLVEADAGDLVTDGGESYCAECHRAVAREDRVEVGGEVYHRQCAPDEAVANRQVDEFSSDGGAPAATCTHCGVSFPPESACGSGKGHNFVAFDGGQPRPETPWKPIDAERINGRWVILVAKWTPDGWTFAERVERDLPSYLEVRDGPGPSDEPVADGGRPRHDHIVAAILEGRRRPSDRLRDGLRADGGGELPAPDRREQERRARQAARSLVAWCERAGFDPVLVLASERESVPRADGGRGRIWDHEDCPRDACDGELQQQDDFNVMCLSCEEVWGHHKNDEEHYLVSKESNIVARKPRDEVSDHYCEICSTEFQTIARLIKHDCDDQEDARLVTDGGAPEDPTEPFGDEDAAALHARKTSDHVQIQVVAGEEVVFHARPRVETALRVFRAAVQVFGSHGWPEKYGESSDNGGDAFQ